MFIQKLREDMLQTRQRRFQYQLTKIASIGTFFGASGIITDKLNSPLLYYFIPFIAISFDLFILSESFTLRRIAAYIRSNTKTIDQTEAGWEIFVKQNPDFLASFANSVITIASSIGAFVLLLVVSQANLAWFENGLNMFWFVFVLAGIAYIRYAEWKLSTFNWRYDKKEKRG